MVAPWDGWGTCGGPGLLNVFIRDLEMGAVKSPRVQRMRSCSGTDPEPVERSCRKISPG